MFSIELVGNPKFVSGYVQDFRQPVIIYQFAVKGSEAKDRFGDRIRVWDSKLGLPPSEDVMATPDYLLSKLTAWANRLLDRNNHPACQPAKVILASQQNSSWFVLQPCINFTATNGLMAGLIKLWCAGADNVDAQIAKLELVLQQSKLRGFNQFHFIKTAHELNIPWEIINGGVVLLGWGKNSRWLESSFTDKTPAISAQLSRHKFHSGSYLRRAGIPVPEQFMVRQEDQLKTVVEKVGFPLVVKPVDKDGGLGVKANLNTSDEVLKAFREVKKITENILVERHVPGKDYRIQVVNDEVQGVLERTPGGVTGNGIDTISTLVSNQNNERATAEDDRRYLHAIEVDEEAGDQLKSQGLDWLTVPAAGHFVRLRGACNVAGGGVPREVPLDEVHEDNKLLARNAARVLRLDVAGIDLLIPDIGASWLETGAHICEVNSQPQMFTTMHGPMLRSMFKDNDGRIPVIVVASDREDRHQLVNLISQGVVNGGVMLGTATEREVWAGGHCLSKNTKSLFASVRMLCLNPAIEALLFLISGNEQLQSGWPVDRCDILVIDHQDDGPASSGKSQFDQLLDGAKSMGPKVIISSGENSKKKSLASHAAGEPKYIYCEDMLSSGGQDVVETILTALHEQPGGQSVL